MATSPWAALVGGVGDFVNTQRGFKEEDAENKRKQELFALNKALTEVQTKTAQGVLDYQPTQQRHDTGRYEIETGGTFSPEYRAQVLSGITDPAQRAAQEAQFAQIDARLKTKDDLAGNQNRYYGAQADTAVAGVPAAQANAAAVAASNKWLAEHQGVDPLKSDEAAYHLGVVGRPVVVSHGTEVREREHLAEIQNAGQMAAVRERGRQEREFRQDGLLPGTTPSTDGMVRKSLDNFDRIADSAADDIRRLDQTVAAQVLRWHQLKGRRGVSNDPQIKAELAQRRQERLDLAARVRAASSGTASVVSGMGITHPGLSNYIKSQTDAAVARLPAEPKVYTNPDSVLGAPGTGGNTDDNGQKDFGGGFGGTD